MNRITIGTMDKSLLSQKIATYWRLARSTDDDSLYVDF